LAPQPAIWFAAKFAECNFFQLHPENPPPTAGHYLYEVARLPLTALNPSSQVSKPRKMPILPEVETTLQLKSLPLSR
jgi:hypothetical protein